MPSSIRKHILDVLPDASNSLDSLERLVIRRTKIICLEYQCCRLAAAN